jgi:hypothetical protein
MSEPKASAIPDIFESRKRKILAELSVPEAEYTDLSPKGSVDEAIRDLISDINALPGLVTTSSCAGRISVFLEGRKKQQQPKPQEEQERQFIASGGKGAGKWLYVSHDALEEYDVPSGGNSAGEDSHQEKETKSLHELFGMVPGDGKPPGLNKQGKAPRLVRFHFEPLVRTLLRSFVCDVYPFCRYSFGFSTKLFVCLIMSRSFVFFTRSKFGPYCTLSSYPFGAVLERGTTLIFKFPICSICVLTRLAIDSSHNDSKSEPCSPCIICRIQLRLP